MWSGFHPHSHLYSHQWVLCTDSPDFWIPWRGNSSMHTSLSFWVPENAMSPGGLSHFCATLYQTSASLVIPQKHQSWKLWDNLSSWEGYFLLPALQELRFIYTCTVKQAVFDTYRVFTCRTPTSADLVSLFMTCHEKSQPFMVDLLESFWPRWKLAAAQT